MKIDVVNCTYLILQHVVISGRACGAGERKNMVSCRQGPVKRDIP